MAESRSERDMQEMDFRVECFEAEQEAAWWRAGYLLAKIHNVNVTREEDIVTPTQMNPLSEENRIKAEEQAKADRDAEQLTETGESIAFQEFVGQSESRAAKRQADGRQ